MYIEMHVYSYVHPYFTEVVNFWQCQMLQLTLFYDRLKIKKQCNVWKVKVLVTQLCPILFDPLDCSPPGSFVYGILQARILQWVAYPFSRGSSQPRDQTWVSCIAGRFFTIWATWEAPCNVYVYQITILYTMHILQFYVNYASIKLKLRKGKTKETEPHIPLGVDRVQQYNPVVHILSLLINWLVCKHWMACGVESAVFICQASLIAPLVKNPPEMWETWVWSWVGRIPWRRERLPTPVFWPGEFHRLCSPWALKESDTTERLSLHYAHMSAQHLTKSMS